MDLFNPERLWIDDENRESQRQFEARIEAAIDALESDSEGRKILPLAHPITMTFAAAGQPSREEVVETISIRRTNGGDLRSINMADPAPKLALTRLERLTGLSAKQIDKITESDLKRAFAVAENFT